MSTQVHSTPTRFRWLRPSALATVLVLPLALGACGGGNDTSTADPPADNTRTGSPTPGGTTGGTDSPGTSPRRDGPSGPTTPGTKPTPTPTPPTASTAPTAPTAPGDGQRQVRTAVYFLHGEQVSPAPRSVVAPTTAAGALRALLAGPDRFERGHDRTTSIPSDTALNSVVIRDRIATVDLSERYDDGGGSLSMRARLAQVVFTATRFPSIDKVRFELDGKPVTAFGGEGIVLNRPVGRTDFEDLAPQILVESPLIGETIRTPVRVWGSANTFEATLRLKVTDAAGGTAANVFATATSGSGTRGTYDVTIPYKAARSGAGVLTAYYDSPKDGRPVIIDTVPLTVKR
ncbi:Gmad2 immunoglobulin-like domain-containing protein [Streptomyces sp. E11-3]|uniref:GerMN domain-containing protein n=1 Tax=Streptomyces sp. E11-3 TaxID=3110112 RepID=UPI00397EB67D